MPDLVGSPVHSACLAGMQVVVVDVSVRRAVLCIWLTGGLELYALACEGEIAVAGLHRAHHRVEHQPIGGEVKHDACALRLDGGGTTPCDTRPRRPLWRARRDQPPCRLCRRSRVQHACGPSALMNCTFCSNPLPAAQGCHLPFFLAGGMEREGASPSAKRLRFAQREREEEELFILLQ